MEQNARPQLWNPNAAACWSLLFTPVFGGFLHARNAERLGRPAEADSNRRWMVGTLAYLGISFLASIFFEVPQALDRAAGFAILLTWYFSVARKQAAYVRDELNDEYERRGWSRPILFALAALAGLFVVAFVLAFVGELLG